MNLIKGDLAGLEYFQGKKIKPENLEPILNELWHSGDSEFKIEVTKLLQKELSS